jgi:hypothetical protein
MLANLTSRPNWPRPSPVSRECSGHTRPPAERVSSPAHLVHDRLVTRRREKSFERVFHHERLPDPIHLLDMGEPGPIFGSGVDAHLLRLFRDGRRSQRWRNDSGPRFRLGLLSLLLRERGGIIRRIGGYRAWAACLRGGTEVLRSHEGLTVDSQRFEVTGLALGLLLTSAVEPSQPGVDRPPQVEVGERGLRFRRCVHDTRGRKIGLFDRDALWDRTR